ncbi:DNA double-strand break repair nuclease NurA [Methanobrevibacter thaueri]|jgi:NurA-like 5'-3' nuclease|uniref:NurA domain protein n=1 Tax=Methanobrevibacter thaueri TaxID=190975 RepID=A0A315XRH1_9EURY|nr:DNA double-strand break repair nuclease NurA [Methanobrevibacter thaueri]PWB87669.1 NurA domain protein [Methanobrevibacter thaueri]
MLNSLYEKAIAKRGFIQDIESDTDIESQLEHKWFNRFIDENHGDFSIAAGDGSFNKKKFLTTNFCAVGAESIIYDGEIKKIDDSDIFDIPHVSFLDELLSNYMAIYELKCALRAIKDYNVDYYMLDGSILGDLQNAFPRGAKLPSKIKENLDESTLNEFERRLSHRHYGLVFPEIRDSLKLMELPKSEEMNKVEEYNLHLASIEKIILLREILQYRKKIISISKTSSDNELFHWNIPDIAFLDKFTHQQGMSIIKYKSVWEKAAFPYYNDFFKKITFTIFYVRFQNNKNVLKVELPYKASKDHVFELIKKINALSVQGYPYLLNKAHNDVVITDRNMKELVKIAKIYETTNREVMSW